MFTAGSDLGDFTDEPARGEDAPVFQFMWALHRFPKPVMFKRGWPAVASARRCCSTATVYCADNAAFSDALREPGPVPRVRRFGCWHPPDGYARLPRS